MSLFQVMLVAVGLVLVFAALGLVFLKVRRIHLATFRLVADLVDVRREVDSLFTQLQALRSLEQVLRLDMPLPPLRGWAGSPDFLLVLAEEVIQRRPLTVVELGSGASTLVVARCLQLNGGGHLYSLEHDSAYAEKTRRLLARHGLEQWVTLLEAPLERDSAGNLWYSGNAIPPDLAAVEILVVDGPPASVGPRAREPAFPRLRERFAAQFLIIVDDADRPDESDMVEHWLALEPRLKRTLVPAEKGLTLLECDRRADEAK